MASASALLRSRRPDLSECLPDLSRLLVRSGGFGSSFSVVSGLSCSARLLLCLGYCFGFRSCGCLPPRFRSLLPTSHSLALYGRLKALVNRGVPASRLLSVPPAVLPVLLGGSSDPSSSPIASPLSPPTRSGVFGYLLGGCSSLGHLKQGQVSSID